MNQCKMCHFWAQYPGSDDAKGQCGMIVEQETRVIVVPLIRKNGETVYRMIKEHDQEFPENLELSAMMVTPPDFGCEAWQERDDPSDWWKST